jgi:signal transduction histidine kinase
VVIAAALVLLVIAGLLWRNNRQKQAANILLRQQKEKLESTLDELRLTQAQLIQSEKMASLGVLTAGIAHEIQNPLNFVNNFSEVNVELIRELKAEHLKPYDKRDVELENDVLDDLEVNEEKITLHGKRASSIVKSMLQHSRTSTGQREPTDINALADEYLRLSYHGMRAKDKSFTVALDTHFDPALSLPENKLNVVPEDIGRVLLNLYNNAFYAVSEKAKNPEGFQNPRGFGHLAAHSSQLAANNERYVPTVTVVTKKTDDKILISVKDNGPGIPQNIVDKIFQPFFTTKPTGQGTGLGLSLSYDIIKAHGGEINVETTEGEKTEFIIQLPA